MEGDSGNTVQAAIKESAPDETIYILSPTAESLSLIAQALYGKDERTPTCRVVADASVTKAVSDSFPAACRIAELTQSGSLQIRVSSQPAVDAVIVNDDVTPISGVGGDGVGVGESPQSVRDSAEDQWDNATEFESRRPPMAQMLSEMDDTIGHGEIDEAYQPAEVAADYRDTVQQLVDIYEDYEQQFGVQETADGLDFRMLLLLGAAKDRILFYDMCEWADEQQITSKPTFSRLKNKLEAEPYDYIRTERVPVPVGRPRQRLTLTDSYRRQSLVELAADLWSTTTGKSPVEEQ